MARRSLTCIGWQLLQPAYPKLATSNSEYYYHLAQGIDHTLLAWICWKHGDSLA